MYFASSVTIKKFTEVAGFWLVCGTQQDGLAIKFPIHGMAVAGVQCPLS